MSLENKIWLAELASMSDEQYGHIQPNMGLDQQQPPAIAQIPKPTNFRGIETSKDFLARYRPSEYIVDGVLETGMTYALTGYTGHGKTSATLFLCLCILKGMEFGGHEVEPGSVLYLAGENPDNVLKQWIALCSMHDFDPCHPGMHWHYGYFDIKTSVKDLQAQADKISDLRLVVADTLQAFFAGESDNDNIQMMDSARSFRELGQLKSKPAILIPAHPAGKKPDRSTLVPRGGGAFPNEIDGNFTIWNGDEETLKWSWQGKLRGAPFDPVTVALDLYACGQLKDRKGRVPLISVVSNIDATSLAMKRAASNDMDMKLMRHIKKHPDANQTERGKALSLSQTVISHRLTRLRAEKLIEVHARKDILTEQGLEVLDDAE
jgi:hypothetical protein